MLLATAGKIAVQLSNENDELVWKAYLKNDLVAECHREDWDILDPDFSTKQAGQMLADAYNEMFAVAELEEDAAMQKSDDGEVQNEPVPPASECCGNCDKPDGHEPCDNSSDDVFNDDGEEHKLIILKLNDLLNKASLAQQAGKPFEHLLAQADIWTEHLNSLNHVALVAKIDGLMKQAEQELEDGLDCEATLNAAEELMHTREPEKVPEPEKDAPHHTAAIQENPLKRFFNRLAALVK